VEVATEPSLYALYDFVALELMHTCSGNSNEDVRVWREARVLAGGVSAHQFDSLCEFLQDPAFGEDLVGAKIHILVA